MQKNPDLNREEAEEILAEKKAPVSTEEGEAPVVNPLLDALTKPVTQ